MASHAEEPLIPYISEPHPVTGVSNGKLAIWVFLASEVMLFGAFFSSYILLRVGSSDWNEVSAQVFVGNVVTMAAINTAVLIISSVTVVLAWISLKLNDFNKFRILFGITILCALVFCGIKYFEYSEKIAHGYIPSAHNLFAIYFTMTGLHMLHVIGGVVVMGYLVGPGAKMWKTDPVRFTGRIECTGLYWHFVDLVWIFLFPTIYLL